MQNRIVQAVTLPFWWLLNRVTRAQRRRRRERIQVLFQRVQAGGGVDRAEMHRLIERGVIVPFRLSEGTPRPEGMPQDVWDFLNDGRAQNVTDVSPPCFTCGEPNVTLSCCHPSCHRSGMLDGEFRVTPKHMERFLASAPAPQAVRAAHSEPIEPTPGFGDAGGSSRPLDGDFAATPVQCEACALAEIRDRLRQRDMERDAACCPSISECDCGLHNDDEDDEQ